jgi:hypothetical protein
MLRESQTTHSKKIPVTESTETESLNFKVSAEFKREFKGYAVSQGVSMIELLREGFELVKQSRKQ